MVIGNINAPRLIIEEGVILNGNYSIKSNKIEDKEQEKTAESIEFPETEIEKSKEDSKYDPLFSNSL